MTDGLYLFVVKQLEKDDLVDSCLNHISRIIVLYICRFIGKRQYRKALKTVLTGHKDQINAFNCLKEDLDDNIAKNKIFKGVHAMASYPRKTKRRYAMVADALELPPMDLLWATETLTSEERTTLASERSTIPIHTRHGVENYVRKVTPTIKKLCRERLSFVTNYDGGHDREDMVGDLSLHAVRLVRHYEVEDLTEEHLIRLVQQGIKNRVKNIAGSYGRPKRRSLQRVHERPNYRVAWFFSRRKQCVKKVIISSMLSGRSVTDSGLLKIHALFKKTGSIYYVPIRDLYNTRQEAVRARERYQAGDEERSQPLIDFNVADLDDFQVNRTSLLQECGDSGVRIIDLIPDGRAEQPSDGRNTRDFITSLDASSHELGTFAKLVASDKPDALFSRYLEGKNRDVGALTPEQMGKQASQFLQLSLEDLKLQLLGTRADLWNPQQRALIAKQLND